MNSYLDLNFEVIEKADNGGYDDGNDIKLVNLRPNALFSNLNLTTSSGKHLEENSHAYIVSLMYKLITSAKILMICLLDSIEIEIEVETNSLETKT